MMTDDKIKANLNHFNVFGKISIENGLVSCTSSVYLPISVKVSHLPVQFKSVGGDFLCYSNDLESLAGAPQQVDGNFLCYRNKLKSLAGAPRVVGGDFKCLYNELESLTGAPRVVGGDFDCSENQLKSLAGAPHLIDGQFVLTYAANLPLLPLLNISGVTRFGFVSNRILTNQDLSVILNRWANTGTRGMVPCAMEMIKAGYRSNAKL
jgi:hypothetical protein